MKVFEAPTFRALVGTDFFHATATAMMSTPKSYTRWFLTLGVVLVSATLLLPGCSQNSEESASSSASQPSQQRAPQAQGQQGAPSPMPSSPQRSSADVTEEQVQTAARILMSVQAAARQDQMQTQREMQEKYGNPQQMDSTEMAAAREEMQRRQQEMRKKQMKMMQQEAEAEGMAPQRFQTIMRSAQQDSTLRTRLRQAMKAQVQNQAPQAGPMQQNR
jgi:flagellar biosynthesis GTPase FlhF